MVNIWFYSYGIITTHLTVTFSYLLALLHVWILLINKRKFHFTFNFFWILKYVSNKQLLTNLPKYLIFFTWSICEFYLYIWNTAGLDEPPLCSHPGTVGMRWASEGDQPSQRHASSRGPAGPKPDHNTEWWTRQTVILGWYHMSWYGSCPWKWKLSIKIHGCIKIYCICHFALILSKL